MEGVWSIVKEVDRGVLRVKALALKRELAKHGLTSEEDVKRAWQEAIRYVQGFNGDLSVKFKVKFLNVYCLTEIEVAKKGGNKRRRKRGRSIKHGNA